MTVSNLMLKIHADIERVGWSAIGVLPTVDEVDPGPPFLYSIGFQDHGHPEVIVVGLPHEVMHGMVANFYKRVSEGELFRDGERVVDILHGYEVEMRTVPQPGRPLYQAMNYYCVEFIDALQVLWPDKEGFFPGEDGMDANMEYAQDIERVRDDD